MPVRNLLDCLEGGYTIDEFLEDFPSVRREQLIELLEEVHSSASAGTLAAIDVWRS